MLLYLQQVFKYTNIAQQYQSIKVALQGLSHGGLVAGVDGRGEPVLKRLVPSVGHKGLPLGGAKRGDIRRHHDGCTHKKRIREQGPWARRSDMKTAR